MSVPGQSAAIPVTPEEIVESAVAANAAGAAIVHIHVREPETGKPIADLGLFKEVLAGIGERCDAIVQPTSGGGVGMTIEERARVVTECRPGDGDVQLRLVQLRHLQGAPPARDGAVGDRVPRVHARLRLQEHVRRHPRARGAVPRGGHQARVRGLRRRPPLQPRPPRRARGWSTSRSTSSSCSACSAPTPPRSTSSCTCAAPRPSCSAPTGSRGRRRASATPASSTSPRPR